MGMNLQQIIGVIATVSPQVQAGLAVVDAATQIAQNLVNEGRLEATPQEAQQLADALQRRQQTETEFKEFIA